MQQGEIEMSPSHLRDISGSAVDLWPAKIEEKDIFYGKSLQMWIPD